MKKDAVYSLRINNKTMECLRMAAKDERRSVASLLDKIITDYLLLEGYLTLRDHKVERRRTVRKKVNIPAISINETIENAASIPCLIQDISPEGVLFSVPKGSGFNIASTGDLPRFRLGFSIPEMGKPLQMDCTVRHIRDAGQALELGCAFDRENPSAQQALRKYLM